MSKEIYTKSIQEKAKKADGIRICIMRRIKPEFEFDIWMPVLAPSTKLLKEYHDKKINWNQFEEKFKKEVLTKQTKYLKILMDVAEKETITLLCWEETPEKCHRRLVAEKLKKMNPTTKVFLK